MLTAPFSVLIVKYHAQVTTSRYLHGSHRFKPQELTPEQLHFFSCHPSIQGQLPERSSKHLGRTTRPLRETLTACARGPAGVARTGAPSGSPAVPQYADSKRARRLSRPLAPQSLSLVGLFSSLDDFVSGSLTKPPNWDKCSLRLASIVLQQVTFLPPLRASSDRYSGHRSRTVCKILLAKRLAARHLLCTCAYLVITHSVHRPITCQARLPRSLAKVSLPTSTDSCFR